MRCIVWPFSHKRVFKSVILPYGYFQHPANIACQYVLPLGTRSYFHLDYDEAPVLRMTGGREEVHYIP